MFCHSIENHACMEGRTFNRGKQFVCRCALQIPAKSHPAEIRIHQHGAITIVPSEAQQSRLPSAIGFESFCECCDICARATCDRIEDVTYRRQPSFDSGAMRMHASLDRKST